MTYKGKYLRFVFLTALFFTTVTNATAADKLGIFELVRVADAGFEETAMAVEQALRDSPLVMHGQHDVEIRDNLQQARIFVLTSPELLASSAKEPPETISGQILRVAVYTHGQATGTLINMANPVAHAMVFYADSPDYDAIIEAAGRAANQVRNALSEIPGTAMSVQQEPLRTEKHYRKYKGDGPARMMTKFRTWEKSQLVIRENGSEEFTAVVDELTRRLKKDQVSTVDDASPWQLISMIPLRDDAVYFGITNRFIEDRMVQINSDYRSDGKTDAMPFPGVDHVAALPVEVLVVKTGDSTRVLQYGQMWRMQLYFWDSGYRAFTKNTLIPGTVSNSIEEWLNQ